jgi:tRNA modification GTPase
MLTNVIAALATPAGRSAIGMLRLSGTGAHNVAAEVLQPFQSEPARVARLCQAIHPRTSEVLDEVIYIAYTAPASYTGEDMVEICTHGGLLAPAEVLAALLVAGARQANAGEFTRRAMAQGKLDLLQAEAIADLTAATAPAQRRAAVDQLDRGLSRRIGELKSHVLDLESLCCYEIDFPEEDSGPVPAERIDDPTRQLEAALTGLLDTAVEGERLREGAICVIAGRPNTGKSSLFNALLGRERAIVTEVPGTTRDAIEAPATCGGFPFRLIDTAGLRESDDRVERLGVEVSHRYLSAADVVLLCVDATEDVSADEREFVSRMVAPTIIVRTKSDLLQSDVAAGADGDVLVSALTGDGLGVLRERLARTAFSALGARHEIELVVTRERHRFAIETALQETREFGAARRAGVEMAFAAAHLRAAVSALDDVIGVVTADDVLDRVFATFCVGK